jgi:hypothetical protein
MCALKFRGGGPVGAKFVFFSAPRQDWTLDRSQQEERRRFHLMIFVVDLYVLKCAIQLPRPRLA